MTDTTIEKITAALSFGEATDGDYETNADCPADGGWINTTVPVFVGDREIGAALIGAWVYTDADSASSGISQAIHDEILRNGFAVCRYKGSERAGVLLRMRREP